MQPKAVWGKLGMKIVVIDFETANDHPSSACAIGITEIHDGKIISTEAHIIEPPTNIFRRSFTKIHGLKWEDCKGKLTFKDFYFDNISKFENADFSCCP